MFLLLVLVCVVPVLDLSEFQMTVAPQLVGLLGNMSHLLRRGKDNSAAFKILEAYLLLQVCQTWYCRRF
jgi:hypothetical protein